MASDITCSGSFAARAPETALDASVLDIDCAAETALIGARLVEIVGRVHARLDMGGDRVSINLFSVNRSPKRRQESVFLCEFLIWRFAAAKS